MPSLRPLLEATLALVLLLSLGRWLGGLLGRRGAVYRLGWGRQLRLAFWPLLAVGTGLSAALAVPLGGHGGGGFEWALAAGFLGLTLALGGPALLLHGRYWALNQGTTVVFEPQSHRLEVYEGGQRVLAGSAEIRSLERVTCRARRAFRTPYDYLRLHLADGRVLTLTSLLADWDGLAHYLRAWPTEARTAAWCWA